MDKEYTKEELLATEVAELEKIKLIHDILDNNDTRGWFEKNLKDILIPAMPILTAAIGVILFFNGCYERDLTKKEDRYKQAESRYNSEIEIVKFVWDDMKNRKDQEIYNYTLTYINKLDSVKNLFYVDDNKLLGIKATDRPVKLLLKANYKISNDLVAQEVSSEKEVDKTKVELEKASDTDKPASVTKIKSIVVKNAVEKIAKNQLTVYIQYSNKEDKASIDNLAEKLKSFYVVPGIDYVENKSYFQNEIRYYSEADLQKAIDLAKKLRQLYNKDFQLRNINQAKKNTIEVWIDNAISKTQPIAVEPVVKNVADYTEETYERFAAKRYFNYINDDISVHVLGYNPEKRFVTMKINDRDQFDVNIGETSKDEGFGDYQIYIKFKSYEKKSILQVRYAAYYTITIRKKK